MTGLVRLRLFSLAAFSTAALPKLALAHPGHAYEVVSSDSLLHYFFQWEHLAVLLACAGLLACSVLLLMRTRVGGTIMKSKRTKMQLIRVRKDGTTESLSSDDRHR